MSRVVIKVRDTFEYPASVELTLWPDAVVVWYAFRSWGMGGRQGLRSWLASPAGRWIIGDAYFQVTEDQVSFGIDPSLPKRALAASALADLRRCV